MRSRDAVLAWKAAGLSLWSETSVEGELTMAKRQKFRTIFISDLHLGSGGCRGAELAAFLKRVECEKLYLVGDVLDMWRLKQRWYWPSKHNRVVTRILKIAHRGARVIYIPGNHDEYSRQYVGLNFGGVEVMRDAEHLTADGKRLYVTHGDQFDLVVKHARLVSVLGSWAYDSLVVFNTRLNWVRKLFGLSHWSLSRFVKLRVKGAVNYIAKFEDALIAEAKSKSYDGVVCGHIHKPEIRLASDGDAELDYYNCGDWVESCTAIVEHMDGRLELISGLDMLDQIKAERDVKREKKRAKVLAAKPSAPLLRRPQDRLVGVPRSETGESIGLTEPR